LEFFITINGGSGGAYRGFQSDFRDFPLKPINSNYILSCALERSKLFSPGKIELKKAFKKLAKRHFKASTCSLQVGCKFITQFLRTTICHRRRRGSNFPIR
jgi:hypothetical protein